MLLLRRMLGGTGGYILVVVIGGCDGATLAGHPLVIVGAGLDLEDDGALAGG